MAMLIPPYFVNKVIGLKIWVIGSILLKRVTFSIELYYIRVKAEYKTFNLM